MKPLIALLAALLAVAIATPAITFCQATPEAPPGAGDAPEWESFGRQLERIADLLERHLEGRKLELLTRRLEIAATRMVPLQEELARARSGRSSLLAERGEIDERIQSTADRIAIGALDAPPAEVDAFSAEMERRLGRVVAELRQLDRRIAEIEANLSSRQRELDDWQAYLDRELAGM